MTTHNDAHSDLQQFMRDFGDAYLYASDNGVGSPRLFARWYAEGHCCGGQTLDLSEAVKAWEA